MKFFEYSPKIGKDIERKDFQGIIQTLSF